MAGRKKGGCFIQERQRKKRRGSEEIDVGYVPVCLHEHLQYDRKGQRSLSDITKKVFRFVKSNFEIPSDIERSKEFGTLSGQCYETRVINAYSHGLLTPKTEQEKQLIICITCAQQGHLYKSCPNGF